MTRDSIIALIMARLRRPNDAALAALIIPELALFQTAAERSDMGQMWFLLRYDRLTVSVDRKQATLPDDFVSFPQEEECLFLPANNPSDTSSMVASTRFQASGTFLGKFDGTSGAGWSLQGTTINFAAALNSGDIPFAIYYGLETTQETAYLSGGQPSPNLWMVNAPDWLIAEICYLFATTYLKWDDAEPRFGGLRTAAKARLITQNTIQEEGARVRILNEFFVRSRESRGGFTEN